MLKRVGLVLATMMLLAVAASAQGIYYRPYPYSPARRIVELRLLERRNDARRTYERGYEQGYRQALRDDGLRYGRRCARPRRR